MAKLFSNVWFKCIAVLLALAVILGGTLAILNDALYVTADERTSRAIKKIYGEEKSFSIVLDVDAADRSDDPIENQYGRINKIYTVGEDTLYQTTGFNGYKNGTVTLWIKINGGKIDKVILESYDKQTLMSKLGSEFYDNFLVDVTEAYQSGELFSSSDASADNYNPVTGATRSANAACNAVNCVIEHLKNVEGGTK